MELHKQPNRRDILVLSGRYSKKSVKTILRKKPVRFFVADIMLSVVYIVWLYKFFQAKV